MRHLLLLLAMIPAAANAAASYVTVRSYPFRVFAVTPDVESDRLVAAADHCGKLAVFDLGRTDALWERRMAPGPPCLVPGHWNSVALSWPHLFVGRIGGSPLLLDAATGQSVAEFENPDSHDSYRLALSADRRLIAGFDSRKGSVAIWNTVTRKFLSILVLNPDCTELLSIQWSRDGERLALLCPEGLDVWQWADARLLIRHKLSRGLDAGSLSHKLYFSGAKFSPGFRFAAVSGVNTDGYFAVMLLDGATGKILRNWRTGADEMRIMAFSDDEAELCAVGLEGRIHCWRIAEDAKYFSGYIDAAYATTNPMTPTNLVHFSADLRTVIYRALDDGFAVARWQD